MLVEVEMCQVMAPSYEWTTKRTGLINPDDVQSVRPRGGDVYEVFFKRDNTVGEVIVDYVGLAALRDTKKD